MNWCAIGFIDSLWVSLHVQWQEPLCGSGVTYACCKCGSGCNPASKAFYRVTVALDSQTVAVYGYSQPWQAGMLLEADIVQDKRRLYEWVLEPSYSLTGKRRE